MFKMANKSQHVLNSSFVPIFFFPLVFHVLFLFLSSLPHLLSLHCVYICSVPASCHCGLLMVQSVDNSSPWACVNLSLPTLFFNSFHRFFPSIFLLLHFISRRFVLMDFTVILPLMAFAFNG